METIEITGLNEYQQRALETAVYPTDKKIIYPTLGLTGEAGEVADKVKKVIRDNGQQFDEDHRNAIALEISDVLWYVAVLANDLGYTLQNIAEMNYAKLKSRQERGKIGGSGDNR
jgi:NTP pyrophosphatase (non-canonical NTP hydrolase)